MKESLELGREIEIELEREQVSLYDIDKPQSKLITVMSQPAHAQSKIRIGEQDFGCSLEKNKKKSRFSKVGTRKGLSKLKLIVG